MSWSLSSAELSSPMNGLADADLGEIFKRLPTYERLIVSEVCRRWHQISRKAWLDIKTLDLSPIPGKHIGAVVKQCPNLQSIFAVRKSFGSRELICLTEAHGLSSVMFYACEFTLSAIEPDSILDVFKTIFSDRLEHTSWVELVLHDATLNFPLDSTAKWVFSATYLPLSLRRLQVSQLWCSGKVIGFHCDHLLLEGLERLQSLESFIWHGAKKPVPIISNNEAFNFIHDTLSTAEENFFRKIFALGNLKELCVSPAMLFSDELSLSRLTSSLPKLEVLLLNNVLCDETIKEDLSELITKNSVLRILILSGLFDAIATEEHIDLPTRKRFPHGFGGDPLPLLHVFAAKRASEKIRFAKSTSDAAISHPINESMPELLEREDIMQVFEGVWMAEKIRESAQYGDKPWSYT